MAEVRLTDEKLKIQSGDSLPVRAAKISLLAGRQLNKDDDPRMVEIVTSKRVKKKAEPSERRTKNRGAAEKWETSFEHTPFTRSGGGLWPRIGPSVLYGFEAGPMPAGTQVIIVCPHDDAHRAETVDLGDDWHDRI